MELSAIRHIADKRCCLSVGNNGFLFRIQTKKSDVSEIVLHTLDKYMKPEVKDTKQAHMMKKSQQTGFAIIMRQWCTLITA